MDDEARQALAAMQMPKRPINFVPAKAGEILKLGHITCRIMEDGSRTDNRIGSAEFTVPAKTAGPPAHWHEMHDETFLVTQGTIRFHAPDGQIVDAHEGDYVTVPIRAPHTFSNPFDVEAKFFNTYTPSFYINYFKMMAEMSKGDAMMSKEKNLEAMSRFATVPAKPLMEEIAKGSK
ncbi:RmlC-like cupin [Lojkania enalia]|uniref:RmlC-like cupin n=1 Tax=Lojkania enalia TaxID=147567 RepID=A0A9P4KD70_9PLEO|nr:RmlC-like cupin [Didymosphaeria enalia]